MGENSGDGKELSNSVPSKQKKQVQKKKVKQQQNTAERCGLDAAEPRQQEQKQEQEQQNQDPNQNRNHLMHPSSFDQNQMLKRSRLGGMIPDDLVYQAEEERMKARMQQRERAQVDYEEEQKQRRNQLLQVRQFDDAACINKLNEYNYFMHKGSKDNNIRYWKIFVSQFYAESGGEKWCVSSYENTNTEGQILGGSSSHTMEQWCCNICGARRGKGFGANFEILPRLFQMRFASGEIEHFWRLKNPRARKVRPGVMMIEHQAVLETIYEGFRVIRKGKLWVTFRNDLKILSWQFCSSGHEELFPRRIIAPMVNQFIDVANEYQKSIYDCKLGVSTEQNLQDNGNSYLKYGHQLKNYVESPVINDLGFSAKHARCFEIAKIVNMMKGLMDFSKATKTGPIESLQNYPCARSNTPLSANQETAEQNSQTDGIRPMAIVQVHPNGIYNRGENVYMGSGQDRSAPLHQQHMMNGSAPYQGNLMLNRMSGSQACDAAQQQMIDQSICAVMAEVSGSSVQKTADLGDVQVNGVASINVAAK